MSFFYLAITACVVIAFGVTALCTIVRIVRGPTLLDRMIASDVLLTTLVLTVGADMALRGHTDSIVLMTAIAATAVLATIVVARYVQRPAAATVAVDENTDTQQQSEITKNEDSFFPPTASLGLQQARQGEGHESNDR